MKATQTILILIILFVIAGLSASSAVIVQDHYRWRNDDGTETTATWKADEDTEISISSNENIRIRFDISNQTTNTVATLVGATLQYSNSPSMQEENTWINITTDDSTNDFVLALSDNFADGDDTVNDFLTNETTNNGSGKMFETTTNFGASFAITTNYEFEWCIKTTANVSDTTYYFRVNGAVSGGQFSNTFSNVQAASLVYVTELSPPAIPQNVNINVNESGIVIVNWDEVSEATSYKIFGSDEPDGTFTEIPVGDGDFDGTSWTSSASMGEIKFFRITAVN